MELKKENIALYLEALSRFEKTQFLLEHLSNKINFDDGETTSFDLEVCQSLLVQLVNSPIFTSHGLEAYDPGVEGRGRNLSMIVEKLKILLEELKGEVHEYLSKSLAF